MYTSVDTNIALIKEFFRANFVISIFKFVHVLSLQCCAIFGNIADFRASSQLTVYFVYLKSVLMAFADMRLRVVNNFS